MALSVVLHAECIVDAAVVIKSRPFFGRRIPALFMDDMGEVR